MTGQGNGQACHSRSARECRHVHPHHRRASPFAFAAIWCVRHRHSFVERIGTQDRLPYSVWKFRTSDTTGSPVMRNLRWHSKIHSCAVGPELDVSRASSVIASGTAPSPAPGIIARTVRLVGA